MAFRYTSKYIVVT